MSVKHRIIVATACIAGIVAQATATHAVAADAKGSVRERAWNDDYWMVVFNNAVPGRDDEYNRWYQDVHAPSVVAFKDVVSAQRFRKVTIQGGVPQHPPRDYMIVYDIHSRDISGTFDGFKAPAPSATPVPVDEASSYAITYRALGPEKAGGAPKSFSGGPLKTYYFMVLDGPKAGQEKAFEDWYEHNHLQDMLGTPGWVAAQRFALSATQRSKTAPAPAALAIYRIVTDDVAASFAAIRQRAAGFAKTDAVDDSNAEHFTYEAVGELVRKR